MKTMLRISVAVVALIVVLTSAQITTSATKTWGGGTGTGKDWTSGSNWGGSAPSTNDDIMFNTAGTITFSTMPSSVTYHSLTISQGTVTLAHSSSMTMTLGGNAGTDLTIASGASLTLGTNVSLTLASSATADISGALTINSSRTYNTDGTSVVTTVTGTIVNSGTVSSTTASKLLFQGGSTYEHAQNGGTVPTATWNVASNCKVTGVVGTYPTIGSQTLGNLTWNCTGQTSYGPSQDNPPPTIVGNLTIQSTGSSTGSGSLRFRYGPLTVQGNLSMTGGKLWIAGGTGKDMTVSGNVDISGDSLQLSGGSTQGRLYVAGNFIHTGGAIAATGSGTGWHNEIIFNGTSGQNFTNTGGTIDRWVNFTINNSSGVTLNSDVTLQDTLKLTSGNISTGSNTLTIASTGLVLRTSGHVIGNLAKVYGATGAKTFEVGTANGYSPVRVNATTGTGSFTVKATQGAHPNASDPNNVLHRYWSLAASGITKADLGFKYLAGDVYGSEAQYDIAKYDGTWTFPGGVVVPASDSAYITGVTSFSDWTLAVASALPIQMASFAANVVRDNQVEVAWRTVSETNNYGFEICRKRGDAGEWAKVSFVKGHGTTLAPQSYSYIDAGLTLGKYIYQIKQVDLDGKSQTFPEMSVTVGVGPDKFALAQNYPNPFNPSTVVEFVVPQSGFATMKVYNVLGQEVASLFEGNAEAGKINTARFNASNLPSGMYFYMLRSAGKVESKRMLLMK